MNQPIPMNNLNSIRVNRGPQSLKKTFQDICQSNKMKAIQLLNSKDISFATLYPIIPQVESFNLQNALNSRMQVALRYCANPQANFIPSLLQPVLKWILTTGLPEENLGDTYDEILDNSASELLIHYKDSSVLPLVVDLIFSRNRKGKYIHDLVWCAFKSNFIETLSFIANYIRSENLADNQLAYQLLNFKPQLQPNDKEKQYHNFNAWLNKNLSFLYATGDSLQQTCKPKFWRVNLGAKYLCNEIKPDGTPINPLRDEQTNQLAEFHDLDAKQQKMLSKYSFQTFQKDQQMWEDFMKAPIQKQLSIASKAEMGGLL